MEPRWPPDRVRAYERQSFTNAPDSICTMAPDGSSSRCEAVKGFARPLAWLDDDRLLYALITQDEATLNVWNLRDQTSRRLARTPVGTYSASPDGRWIVCQCRQAYTAHMETRVFPVDHPEQVRTVVAAPLGTQEIWIAWPNRRRPAYVSSLDISRPAAGLPIGATYRLPYVGVTTDGRRVPLPAASVASLDTGTVRIVGSGHLLPVALGQARIVVSANGWLVDTITVHVLPQTDTTRLVDDWTQGLGVGFLPFGMPAPQIVRDTAGRPALLNNGDGDYSSGAYSRSSFDAGQGVGMEAALSTPTTMDQWQVVGLELFPVTDPAALARWDRKTGGIPLGISGTDGYCAFTYPTGEGARYAKTLYGAFQTIPVGPSVVARIRHGDWYRVRIQLFPDGRCGVAINGQPVALNAVGQPPQHPFKAVTQGNSVNTRFLVGPVTVWTGIRPGVDWIGFDTAQSSRVANRRHPDKL